MAHALGSAGAKLVLMSRRQAELDAGVTRAQAAGFTARGVAADLSDTSGLAVAAAAAAQCFGGIDILVNAAGVNLRQPFEEVTPKPGRPRWPCTWGRRSS